MKLLRSICCRVGRHTWAYDWVCTLRAMLWGRTHEPVRVCKDCGRVEVIGRCGDFVTLQDYQRGA